MTERSKSKALATTSPVIEVQSLAVKHRPPSIMGLVGQDHVVSQLQGMIKSKRFPAAILLSGDSGCGKTTTARIIARTINCRNLDMKTFEPCGTCRPCQAGDSNTDYSEINIGSNGGIDEIRSLCQAAKSMPMVGNNRIIMLDEVHRLSAAAAAALLKNLEDSPKRTLWILATTNPEKLLNTIVGRCLKLNITTIEPNLIARQLRIISKREGVDLKKFEGGDEIVKTIVDLSNGSLRDAISILESALFAIHSSKKIDAKSVLTAFLATGEADLERHAATLLIALMTGDVKAIVKSVRTNPNSRGVLQKLRWLVQYLLDNSVGIAKYTPYSAKLFAADARKAGLQLRIPMLMKIQYMLVETEIRFNTNSIDESVLFMSTLGQFAIDNKPKRD